MFNYRYIAEKTGNRIRNLRNEKKMSQSKFIDFLRERGTPIGRNKLIKIEYGEGDTIDLDLLSAMCDILDCDRGYLLCEYDERTRDRHDVHELTGLSEDAINDLYSWNSDRKHLLTILNYLFSTDQFWILLNSMYDYCRLTGNMIAKQNEYNRYVESHPDAIKARKKSLETSGPDIETDTEEERLFMQAVNLTELSTHERYKTTDYFFQILNGIFDERNPNDGGYKKVIAS